MSHCECKRREVDLGHGNILHFDINEVMKKPIIEGQLFYIVEMDALADEYLEELALEDSLQQALTINKEDQLIDDKERMRYAQILDSYEEMDGENRFVELPQVLGHVASVDSQEEFQESAWSELKAPKADLKPLHEGLRYAFFGSDETYPVIVNNNLDEIQLSELLTELEKYKKQLGIL